MRIALIQMPVLPDKVKNIQTGIFYNVFLGIVMFAAQLFHPRNDILSQFLVRPFWFRLLHLYK